MLGFFLQFLTDRLINVYLACICDCHHIIASNRLLVQVFPRAASQHFSLIIGMKRQKNPDSKLLCWIDVEFFRSKVRAALK